MPNPSFDFVVIGAGMAGASIASELAKGHKVLLLERETHPGYHATGRSAALYSEIYGNSPVRALTRASAAFLFSPQGFSSVPLLTPRDSLFFAREDQLDALREFRRAEDIAAATEEISGEEAARRIPRFKQGYVARALIHRGSADIDVQALHQAYLDVAIAVDRYEIAAGTEVRRVRHKWAGLRTFAPDRTLVGFDREVRGFFWLAGQGGYGIQTAPAMAQLGAALTLERPVPDALLRSGVTALSFDAARFYKGTP